jgi:hypothetical protein
VSLLVELVDDVSVVLEVDVLLVESREIPILDNASDNDDIMPPSSSFGGGGGLCPSCSFTCWLLVVLLVWNSDARELDPDILIDIIFLLANTVRRLTGKLTNIPKESLQTESAYRYADRHSKAT